MQSSVLETRSVRSVGPVDRSIDLCMQLAELFLFLVEFPDLPDLAWLAAVASAVSEFGSSDHVFAAEVFKF